MRFKKITMAACFASALMMVSAPASAAAYFIGGKWYFFSLNFDSLLAKISGGDLRAGTTVKADVEVLASNVQCSNPQGKVIGGVGPKGGAYQGTSPIVTANNLTKTDNKVSQAISIRRLPRLISTPSGTQMVLVFARTRLVLPHGSRSTGRTGTATRTSRWATLWTRSATKKAPQRSTAYSLTSLAHSRDSLSLAPASGHSYICRPHSNSKPP